MVQQAITHNFAHISPSAPLAAGVISKSALPCDKILDRLFPELPIVPQPPTLSPSDADSMLDDLIEIIGREAALEAAASDGAQVNCVRAVSGLVACARPDDAIAHAFTGKQLLSEPLGAYAVPAASVPDVCLQSLFVAPSLEGFGPREAGRSDFLPEADLLVPIVCPANQLVHSGGPALTAAQLPQTSTSPQKPTSLPSTAGSSSASVYDFECSEVNEWDETTEAAAASTSSRLTSIAATDEEADSEEERRRRNNECSRRSRAKRKSNERQLLAELRAAERRNAELRAQIARARCFQEEMQEGLVRCIRDGHNKR